jgi:hypothetical protein
MKYIIGFLFCLFVSFSASAQTITLGPISKLSYCAGDTMIVPYQSSGNFAAGNTFGFQLSDANGSFAGFTNGGSNSASSGSISVRLGATGLGFRVRVASSVPYMVSADNGANIKVFGFPSPQP